MMAGSRLARRRLVDGPDLVRMLAGVTAVASLGHVLAVAGEIAGPSHGARGTGRARHAARALRRRLLAGAGADDAGVFALWIGPLAAPLALAGLLAYEHAYIQAGQSCARVREHTMNETRVPADESATPHGGDVLPGASRTRLAAIHPRNVGRLGRTRFARVAGTCRAPLHAGADHLLQL